MKRDIKNIKNREYLMQSSTQVLQWKYFLATTPILEFLTVIFGEEITLWEYEGSDVYTPQQMIAPAQSGQHRRGEMSEKGIYVVAGWNSSNTKIYDMKYYNYPDHCSPLTHIQLISLNASSRILQLLCAVTMMDI